MLKKLSWALCAALVMVLIPSAVLADDPDYENDLDYPAYEGYEDYDLPDYDETEAVSDDEAITVSVRIESLTETLFYDSVTVSEAANVLELLLALDLDEYLVLELTINGEEVTGDLSQIAINDGDELHIFLVEESEEPPLLTLDDLTDEDLEYFMEQLAYDVEQFGVPFEQIFDEHEFYVTGPEKGIWVDRYGGTIWFDGDFIMPELAAFTLDDDTIMLPFRQVIEDLLGGMVVWDADARRVTAEVRGQVVGFSLAGSSIPVIIVNDRIYVPAEAIEEFFIRP